MKIKDFEVTENNCNGILFRLYVRRDTIGKRIDMLTVNSCDTSVAESEYSDICDTIKKICEFRKTHECLLEGDEGFSF